MNHEWAAGLFEGEGYIRQPGVKRSAHEVRIKMTDYDILQRMHQHYGGNLFLETKAQAHHKQAWVWSLTTKTLVKGFLLDILPFLGLRRTYLALNALDAIDKCLVLPRL